MISLSKTMAEKPEVPGSDEARTNQVHQEFVLSYGVLSSRNTNQVG